MSTFSYWEKASFYSEIEVGIIGSGIVGLCTALFLKQKLPGLRVAVFERGTLPYGASTRNAGFACFGSMTELIEDLENRGEQEMFTLVKKRWNGLQLLRSLVGDKQMHYQPVGGFEIFRPAEADLHERCLSRLTHFNIILKELIGVEQVYVPSDHMLPAFGFHGINHIIHNQAEGQVNTGELIKTLLSLTRKAGVQIFNGIEVQGIEETGRGASLLLGRDNRVETKKVLVATNGFARQLLPELKVIPARNQVLITKPLADVPFKGTFHYDRGYYYFRTVEEPGQPGRARILLGGGRNLSPQTEQTDAFGTTPLIRSELEKMLSEIILPGRPAEIDTWWSGILGVGTEKKPIIRKISPSIGVAVRLGGMGVAIGSLIGKEAAEMILQEIL